MLERLKELPFGEAARAEEAASAVSLTQVAWQKLRTDIICGKLRPKTRLRIGKLRDLYGIGASPLREALIPLLRNGLRKGDHTVVASFDTEPRVLYDQDLNTPIVAFARDEAGNEAKATFVDNVFEKKFKHSRIEASAPAGR